MADSKISELTALVSANVASTDVLPIVDISATTTKKITIANLASSIAVNGLNAGEGVRTEIHGILLPTAHGIAFEGATNNDFETILTVTDPTADNTITLPNATGTVALTSNLSSYATLASPTLTGTPAAPTAAASTSTTQVATTAFVINSSQDDQFVLASAIFTS